MTIIREAGERCVPIASVRKIRGTLQLAHVPVPHEERTIAVLGVLEDRTGRKLYEPKIARLGAGVIVFTGLECVDRAWYAQEWSCDLDY